MLGDSLDAAIADLLLTRLTPLAVETSLAVYDELHAQVEAAERLRAEHVERARYAAELAQRRFQRVDPENRLVADVLEAEWNARLRELAQVQEEAARQQEAEHHRLSVLERQAIAELVDDFPRVWRDGRASDRDRKRMVRLLLEEVTLQHDASSPSLLHPSRRVISRRLSMTISRAWLSYRNGSSLRNRDRAHARTESSAYPWAGDGYWNEIERIMQLVLPAFVCAP